MLPLLPSGFSSLASGSRPEDVLNDVFFAGHELVATEMDPAGAFMRLEDFVDVSVIVF